MKVIGEGIGRVGGRWMKWVILGIWRLEIRRGVSVYG